MSGPRVLISGASVAGPVLAYWLHRFGFRPTVVERTPRLRIGGGGHAVDLFGPAVEIMDWMGLLAEVEQARTETQIITLIRPSCRPVEVAEDALTAGFSPRHIEIMRGDLASIVYAATRERVEYIFDDSIEGVDDDGQRVVVRFERRPAGTFDLLIGADGLHSITRRLVFGPEDSFSRFLGGYLAVFTVPNFLQLKNRMATFAVPGRTAAVYPVGDRSQARAVLLWRTPFPHDIDRHDQHAQRRLLRNLYSDLGWEVPRLLGHLDQAEDLYLDSISQVVMAAWTRGRVALVGDAGYSPGAAVGGGTSLAVIGAYLLASELARADGDHRRGFAAYQRVLDPVVRHSRLIGPSAIKLIIPSSRRQIWMIAQALRMVPHIPVGLRRRLIGGSAAAMLDEAHLPQPHDLPGLG